MEKRVNDKIKTHNTKLKNNICEYATSIGITQHEKFSKLLQFIYDQDGLLLKKEDFQKRKRHKNSVPSCYRCSANKASGEQCTRRQKGETEYCGTHLKGTPHGIVNEQDEQKNTIQKIEVFAQDISGIIYYIDQNNNVYQAEDIISNKLNPKIIAKYIKEGEKYHIPEFNI